jgi:lipopolysaccharide transport system ATP-binding protein
MARIELDNVGITFRIRPHGRSSLKEFLVRHWLRKPANPPMQVHALRDVSLRVGEGERLGILGPNGAGKSTLLKLLAGIYPPTRGRRRVAGRISSLFDLSLGFEPEANGWQNIAYRCYLQGETPAGVRARLPEIAEFSELGKFLDVPVRYYSAGMMVRLAFSVATAIEPEILLLDEVFGAGDLSFQHKARQRMQDMMARARLIVLVSHDLDSLARVCSKVIWLDRGRIRQTGSPAQVIADYQAEASAQAMPGPEPADSAACLAGVA